MAIFPQRLNSGLKIRALLCMARKQELLPGRILRVGIETIPLPQPSYNNLSTSLPNRGMFPPLTESLWKGFMAKKTAKLKAKRKAKLRRGRQQQRQNKRIAALRKLKKRMRNKKLRRS